MEKTSVGRSTSVGFVPSSSANLRPLGDTWIAIVKASQFHFFNYLHKPKLVAFIFLNIIFVKLILKKHTIGGTVCLINDLAMKRLGHFK